MRVAPGVATLAPQPTSKDESRVDFNHPMTPAWIVCAWPPVLWQADSASRLQLVHLGTRVLHYGGHASPCSGQTLWGEATPDRSAGVAWDWIEVQEGVVAMADPLGLVTNLKLLDAKGEALSDFEVAVRLNGLVHALPWQTEVQRALHQAND
jgi:hypothetical protein